MKNLPLPDLEKNLLILVLGIIPLLAVSDTAIKGVAIGSINLLVLLATCLVVSILQNLVPRAIRLVTILLVNTTIVCLAGLLLQAWNFEISQQLGMYLSLIAVSTLVLASAEEFAIRRNPVDTLIYTFITGLVVLLMIVIIAAARELSGLVLLKQPAGAFLILGILIALFKYLAPTPGKSG